MAECGLLDFHFNGYQFTWERGRGTANWIEEKLDRILVNDTWMSIFGAAHACSVICGYSDHMPLFLTPVRTVYEAKKSRFMFENSWVGEDRCREIVEQSWGATFGLDVMSKLEVCASNMAKWGKSYRKDFKKHIERSKRRMDNLKGRRDAWDM